MISPTEYKSISDQITELQLIDETSIEFINLLEIEIEDLSTNNAIDDIKATTSEVETKLNARFTEDKSISAFVIALQEHVLKNTIYTDINDYLEDFDIKVKPLFADVSARVGFEISDSNILGRYIDYIPNCIFAFIEDQRTEETFAEVFEEILSWGANSLPITGHTTHIRGAIEDPSEFITCERLLNAQAAVGGAPFQLLIAWGQHALWSGVDEPYLLAPLLRRGTDSYEPWEIGFDEVYHTTIVDALDAYPPGSDLRDLIDDNWPITVPGPDAYADKLKFVVCPGYKGVYYQNALAKLNEACKWYQPIAVFFDQEYMTHAYTADYVIQKIIGGSPTVGVMSSDGLNNCSRCQGGDGFVNNMNNLGITLRETVQANRSDALVTCFYVFDHGDWSDRYYSSYWDYGNTTGYNTGNYSLYELTYDQTGPVGTRDLYYNPVEKYEELMAAGQIDKDHQKWTPEAPVGSYIWFSPRMDIYDATRGYITEEMAYDMAYHLASKGAKGFAIMPQYSGRDKDPDKYPPGGSTYTAEEIADDIAAKMVHKAMFRAFADYFKNHTRHMQNR